MTFFVTDLEGQDINVDHIIKIKHKHNEYWMVTLVDGSKVGIDTVTRDLIMRNDMTNAVALYEQCLGGRQRTFHTDGDMVYMGDESGGGEVCTVTGFGAEMLIAELLNVVAHHAEKLSKV